MKSVSRLGSLLVVIFIGLTGWAQSSSPLIHTVVTTFPTENLWESRENHLRNVGDGKLRSDGPTPMFRGGNCGDLLQNFQEAPLKRMLSDKYINQAIFDVLMNLTQHGVKATQLVLFTQYSEMTRDEAKAFFKGEIPADRNFGMADGGKIRIRRGTMYYTRGFEAVPGAKKPVAFKPLKVPWELVKDGDTWPSKLSRGFDRKKVPFLIEVGRAFAEKDILPGDTKGLASTLIPYLESETWAQGIDPRQLVISGHFLDAQHTRFFTRAFPSLRPLRPELQAQMEADLVGTMDTYLQSPLPKGRDEWNDYNDTVVVGSLAKTFDDFPVSAISDRYRQVLNDRHFGRADDAKARSFLRALQSAHQMMESKPFDLTDGSGVMSEKPLLIMDYGSPLAMGDILASIQRAGAVFSNQEFSSWFEQYVPEFGSIWMNSNDKWETDILLPVDPANTAGIASGDFEPLPSFLISNLDHNKLVKNPNAYLAMVVLGAAADIERQLLSTSEDTQAARRLYAQGVVSETGKTQMASLKFSDFMNSYPLIIALPSHLKFMDLNSLIGAKSHPGLRLQTEMPSGPSNSMDIELKSTAVSERFWMIDYATLMKLRAQYANELSRGEGQLRGELHRLKIRMAYSGVF